MSRKVDVIVPVYRGLEETRECIESALSTLSPDLSQLIVINDYSPDVEVTEYLRERVKTGGFQLLENSENLGFVATVNKGMSLHPENDVLLLNSDVEVANDWLERIIASAYSDARIGSVTPFANNATICSFPNFCEDNALFEGFSVAELDNICAAANPAMSVEDVPTGVGFCMFIKRDCLNKVGLFDVETFGKGYGEENDWCQRAIKSGWRNVHVMNVFAFHKGGVSFADEQDPRKDKALELLDKLHPNYQRDVHHFIAKDPAKPYRINFLLSLIAQDKRPKVLSIDHGLGGGVVQHVEELASYLDPQAYILRLHPCGEGLVKLSFSLKTNIKDALVFNIAKQFDEFVLLCKFLGIGHVHFHHTMGLPTRLWGLPRDLDCTYDVTIHDYYHVNGNPTQTNKQARYCGDDAACDELCAEHYPIPVTADVWRDNQRQLLQQASRVIFPSYDTRDRFVKYFPLKNDVVAWHPDSDYNGIVPAPQFKYPRRTNPKQKLRVLILGAISREKGADLLEKVAESLKAEAVEFHLLGYAYRPLSADVITHGPYQLDEVQAKIAAIAPDIMWFPAQWPETYSYTLSIAFAAGLPVVVPDIGAFAERVAGRKESITKPWDCSVEAWKTFWCAQIKSEKLESNVATDAVDGNVEFYKNVYCKESWKRDREGEISLDKVKSWLASDVRNETVLGRRELVLRRLWRMREHAIFGKIASLIPFKIQRYIKRRLSSKPIHEVVRK
ncbi:MAG: glycosyltransferase [Hahellaceae bacterium]|nr:glycosyltransferase [Hahellaceae bacterium]MCP5211305.1 glycosyltransferase [Hahellaceae bacterium]